MDDALAPDGTPAWTPEGMSALRERIVVCLRATLGPMLRSHLAEELYTLALATDSDLITLRLAAHSEEALAGLLEETQKGAETVVDEGDYYRWWPDEWRVSDDGITPEDGAETTVDLSAAMFDASRVPTNEPDAHSRWCEAARAVLEGALGDARVLARVRELNPRWHPVLFVTDTDGDMRPTVRSVDSLNQGHPSPDLVASARRFFLQSC